MSIDTRILLESGTNEVEFLRFSISKQLYAINVSKVRQVMVFNHSEIVVLPGTPNSLVGSFRFRDKPIPVIDLAIYLNQSSEEVNKRRLLLVTEFNQVIVGFIVDGVDNIMRCSWTQFVPLDAAVAGSDEPTVVGTVMTKTEMIPVLDVEALLTHLVPTADVEARAANFVPPKNVDLSAARILYCEDSSIVRKVLLKCLNAAGINNVEIFGTGKDGLEFLKKSEPNSLDLIISDIEMPEMDGLTFCKELRQLPNFAKTPVIFFSSTITDEMKHKCELVGGNAAFSKPEVDEIVNSIANFLSQ